MSKTKIGVLVMSYGTPESMEQVEDYYTHIRRGKPPTEEQLQELKDRYEAIGGLFPLRDNTNKQVAGIGQALNRKYPAYEFVCYQGLKHASPYIEDGVRQMAADGIKQAAGVVLAPHYSVMSVGGYNRRAEDAAKAEGITLSCVNSYHLHPLLIEALSERVLFCLERFPEDVRSEVRIIFTAHSLPERILTMNDPYVEQLTETARAVAEKCGCANWQIGWQSAGRTPEPWLGPDILEILEQLAREGVSHTVVCPAGFVSDHLEVLYDLDLECRQAAGKLGIQFERTASLNTDPRYLEAVADAVYSRIGEERN